MTDSEMAIEIATEFYRLLAWKTAAEVLLSRYKLEGRSIPWKEQLELEADQGVSPSESPFGQSVAEYARAVAQSGHGSELRILYETLFPPSAHLM